MSCAVVLLLVAVLAISAGCDGAEATMRAALKPHPLFTDYDLSNELAMGMRVYQKHCIGCHGETGDGRGVAAYALNPPPRNFQRALFKFTSTPAGKLPTDDDLMRVLNNGLSGSAMPEFRLLSDNEKRSVIAYLKTFSKRWAEEGVEDLIPIGADPYRNDPETGILDGEYVYHAVATCWQCHPSYVGFDLMNQFFTDAEKPPLASPPEELYRSKWRTSSETDEKGQPLPLLPPDFTYDRIKTGNDKTVLFHRIGAGITGAAMPAWAYALKAEEIWAMSYYVNYLAENHRERTLRAAHVPFAERHPDGVEPVLTAAKEAAAAKTAQEAAGETAQ